ncbi:MAG: 4Fe-4S dicluster domain-containing protein [Acidobacteria bacterium]|nr:4Fe-4S dicluster domain-containing protein [Acidobacteriota bacterium]
MMDSSNPVGKSNNSLIYEIYEKSGEKVQNCYQCQKCAAGCPVSFAMDLLPNQMFRHIQYGHRDKVLSSKTIWLCASCYACSTRCPNNIDIAKVMDTLRGISHRSGMATGEKDISLFHRFFLKLIKYTGRTWEPGFGIYKMKTGGLSGMMGWALKLFLKGKIAVLPTFKGGEDLKVIFEKSEKGGAQ